jgi:hypothetical protein
LELVQYLKDLENAPCQGFDLFGFTFRCRMFDVKIGVPFNESIQKGLEKTAAIVAKTCPTGALAMFGDEEQL